MVTPGPRRAAVLAWLEAHPGAHLYAEVVAGLPELPPGAVSHALLGLRHRSRAAIAHGYLDNVRSWYGALGTLPPAR